ncbi:MAG TPA: cation diffusion facilitator family transporter [Rhodopila sp.]
MSNMQETSAGFVVAAALTGNILIALSKYGAAWLTGSSAMLSEAVHSTVDCGNGLLLMIGLRRGARPPDASHPFGYGMEVYFWSFIVAVLIFGAGAGFSLFEGIEKILRPRAVDHVLANYVALGIAFPLEAASWVISLRKLNRGRGGRGWLEEARRSKDPTVFAVLFEDTAALLGLVAAALGIWLSQILNLPQLDGVASLLIAALLASVAWLLARECQSLLTGEAALPELRREVAGAATAEPGVLAITEMATLHLGPDAVLVALSLEFSDGLTAPEIERAVRVIEHRIRCLHPNVQRVFIEADPRRLHATTAEVAPPGSPAEQTSASGE